MMIALKKNTKGTCITIFNASWAIIKMPEYLQYIYTTRNSHMYEYKKPNSTYICDIKRPPIVSAQ